MFNTITPNLLMATHVRIYYNSDYLKTHIPKPPENARFSKSISVSIQGMEARQ